MWVNLGRLVSGAAVADLRAPDLTQPAFAFGLDEAGFEVVADLFEPGTLRRIRSQERASLASMLMDAGRVSAGIVAMGASRPA